MLETPSIYCCCDQGVSVEKKMPSFVSAGIYFNLDVYIDQIPVGTSTSNIYSVVLQMYLFKISARMVGIVNLQEGNCCIKLGLSSS